MTAVGTSPRPRRPERARAKTARDPRPWPFNRMSPPASRRAATFMLAVLGVLLIVGISGIKVERQRLGYVGVVRNGGPLDDRDVRQILLPGQRVTFTGMFSESPHEYPSVRALRSYTITSNAARGNRPGVDVVAVPTHDGVQVGIEGTVYMRFVGEADPDRLTKFDANIGSRRFPLPSGRALHPYEGDEGFAAMLDAIFRPILDNNLRREIGAFDCAQLVASCALVKRTERSVPAPAATTALRLIEDRINLSLEAELLATLGQPFFRDLHFRLVRVTLPEPVQASIDRAQAAYANIYRSRARLAQAKYETRRTRVLGQAYEENPTLATIDAIRSARQGTTVILNAGGRSRQPSIALGGN